VPEPPVPSPIPGEAFEALALLQAAFAAVLPPDVRFGVGLKTTGGEFTDELALLVFVPDKLPLEQLPPEQRIPDTWTMPAGSFRTDVVESRPTPITDTSPYTPLRGGCEIGWNEPQGGGGLVTTHHGTLGCVTQRRSDGRRQLLTARHVVPLGVHVSQPAPGTLGSSVVGEAIKGDAQWDCSAIEDNGGRGVPMATVEEIGAFNGSADVVEQLWQAVSKRGRTTRLTTGVVVGVEASAGVVTRILTATFPFRGSSAITVTPARPCSTAMSRRLACSWRWMRSSSTRQGRRLPASGARGAGAGGPAGPAQAHRRGGRCRTPGLPGRPRGRTHGRRRARSGRG
jgi:hypothetical protein